MRYCPGAQAIAERLAREQAAAAARQEQRPQRRASSGTGASAASPVDVTCEHMPLCGRLAMSLRGAEPAL